jgi:hypothetical protein
MRRDGQPRNSLTVEVRRGQERLLGQKPSTPATTHCMKDSVAIRCRQMGLWWLGCGEVMVAVMGRVGWICIARGFLVLSFLVY